MCWCYGLGPEQQPSLKSDLLCAKGDGLEPENDAKLDEVDHEVEEARFSDVFEAPIIGTLYCNEFKG